MLMTIAGLTTLMAQQTHDIKGVVTDKRNEPIVGALVTAEGTDISSITDIDGKFLLRDVPVDAKKVIVESIGMETTDAKIDRPIMMAARPKRLSLVVEAGMDWSRYTAEGSDSKNVYHKLLIFHTYAISHTEPERMQQCMLIISPATLIIFTINVIFSIFLTRF